MTNIYQAIAAAVIILVMLFSGYMKIQAYVIGIYTEIEIDVSEVRDMQNYYRLYLSKIDGLKDFEEFKTYEKDRVKYEIKVLNSIEPFLMALDRANQTRK